VKTSILDGLNSSGIERTYAVRSSATAEDLPSASFAGQQESFLNVRGQSSLLRAVHDCWASLFTDRAISYRAKNGFGHRSVFLSVVIQQMVFPEVSGIMFTADPVTGHRNTISINASFGLGEALVSGIVIADLYQVRYEKIITKQISQKKVVVYPVSDGGTKTQDLSKEMQDTQALPDDKIVELSQIGRSIEKYYGSEQDIEWCLADEKFYIVQSRPITSLYPIPKKKDHQLHLYISFGHPQMMTEAIKPLGISVLRTIIPFRKSSPEAESDLAAEAGNRIYIDLNPILEYRRLRDVIPKVLVNIDELIARAVFEFLQHEEYQSVLGHGKKINFKLITYFPLYFHDCGHYSLSEKRSGIHSPEPI
jgi:pyruvate,water dikinase